MTAIKIKAFIVSIFVFSMASGTRSTAQVLHRTENIFPVQQTLPYQAGYIPISNPVISYTANDIQLKKGLEYDQHTLEDEYPYGNTTRSFQWDKIKVNLAQLETFQYIPSSWGIVQNRKNVNGVAPLAKDAYGNEFNNAADRYGVERYQGIPLYDPDDLSIPERYAYDGSLIKIIEYADTAKYVTAETLFFEGRWLIPTQYVKTIDTTVTRFYKTVFIDRTNQNICTIEKRGLEWVILSMNPATTGADNPPYQKETPLGIYVVQEKKEKMIYLADGSGAYGGFAPWASRFCNGGYVHGVPVNAPGKNIIEYSATLGTIPRSHMCVRNASSHAKFVFDWAPVGKALFFVIE